VFTNVTSKPVWSSRCEVSVRLFHNILVLLMYVCPCIIYEIEERYPLDAKIYLLL